MHRCVDSAGMSREPDSIAGNWNHHLNIAMETNLDPECGRGRGWEGHTVWVQLLDSYNEATDKRHHPVIGNKARGEEGGGGGQRGWSRVYNYVILCAWMKETATEHMQ